MESPKLDEFITSFPEKGDNVVEKAAFSVKSGMGVPPVDPGRDGRATLDRVHINKTQYLDGVPEAVWTFHAETLRLMAADRGRDAESSDFLIATLTFGGAVHTLSHLLRLGGVGRREKGRISCISGNPTAASRGQDAGRRRIFCGPRRDARWCNGSTRPFGGQSPGSSPGRATRVGRLKWK